MLERYNTLGITRKRFDIYLKQKGKQVIAKKRFSKKALRNKLDDDDMIKTNLLTSATRASQIELAEMSEQPWMADYQQCCMLLQEVDELSQEIKQERAKKLLAINDTIFTHNIQRLNEQATWKISSCEKILKKMGSSIGFESSSQQKKLFSNVIMSLAMKIRERAKSIRESQQKDLQMAKQLNQFNKTQIQGTDLMLKDQHQQYDQQQFQRLEKRLHDQRNQQILKIVTSIHSLNSLYKELQNVVIQQGSLLDRIDQNLDSAAQNIKQANVHLTKAQQHQKSPLANRVIGILIFLIMACLLILYARQ